VYQVFHGTGETPGTLETLLHPKNGLFDSKNRDIRFKKHPNSTQKQPKTAHFCSKNTYKTLISIQKSIKKPTFYSF